jgi:peptidoglycan/xylan/chitin deacetylase (PgdA/CDA1 family)
MGLAELAAVQRAGMTIAAHSRTHPNLTKLADAQLRDEVTGSRQDLQKMLGIDAALFAYPYGAWNGRVAAAVQEAGYRAARAYPGGVWNDAAHRFTLRSVVATDDMAAFEREVGGPVIVARLTEPVVPVLGTRRPGPRAPGTALVSAPSTFAQR